MFYSGKLDTKIVIIGKENMKSLTITGACYWRWPRPATGTHT